ncbi:MAG TPA: hypothetical protein VHG28_17625 [Longimicrobiaceae bacterium]|nr:hypothetical protein [Longimicrobiaceae bacterium]
MNRLLVPALTIFLGLPASGCGSQTPTEDDYLDVVRQTVRFAEADARRSAVQGAATGPLLVDVNSFRGGSLRATGKVIEKEKVAGAIDRQFRETVPDSSFNCMDTELGPSCWVPKNGVFVHLNLASRAPQRITMHYTSTVTASNFIPPVLCDRTFRLEFVKRGTGWVLQDTVPLKSC